MSLNASHLDRSAINRCWLWLALLILIGCDSVEPIRRYTIPTAVPAQLQPSRQQIIGAMVPLDSEVWFYKIAGPTDAVESVKSKVREFVKTLEYAGGVPDLENLPDDWNRAEEKPFRFASINIDTVDKQLDLSISKLTAGEDWDAYVAMNINRWRDQLGLENSDQKWAGAEPFEVDAVPDRSSIWFDATGKAGQAATPSMPPFAGTRAAPTGSTTVDDPHANLPKEVQRQIATGENTAKPAATETPESSSSLQYDRPEDWRDGRMSMMRMAAFEVGDESNPTEITVITAGGDIRSNVKRWLGQAIGETPSDEQVDEAMSDAEEVDVDGRPGQRFLLSAAVADSKAIDAIIVPLDDGMSLFIKMTGDKATVTDQREALGSFAQSLSF